MIRFSHIYILQTFFIKAIRTLPIEHGIYMKVTFFNKRAFSQIPSINCALCYARVSLVYEQRFISGGFE
jgi:hypothetical protein